MGNHWSLEKCSLENWEKWLEAKQRDKKKQVSKKPAEQQDSGPDVGQ